MSQVIFAGYKSPRGTPRNYSNTGHFHFHGHNHDYRNPLTLAFLKDYYQTNIKTGGWVGGTLNEEWFNHSASYVYDCYWTDYILAEYKKAGITSTIASICWVCHRIFKTYDQQTYVTEPIFGHSVGLCSTECVSTLKAMSLNDLYRASEEEKQKRQKISYTVAVVANFNGLNYRLDMVDFSESETLRPEEIDNLNHITALVQHYVEIKKRSNNPVPRPNFTHYEDFVSSYGIPPKYVKVELYV